MKGNTSAVGNNMKSFGAPVKIEKGSDPMPRGTGQLASQPMEMDIKDFSRTKQVICNEEKY